MAQGSSKAWWAIVSSVLAVASACGDPPCEMYMGRCIVQCSPGIPSCQRDSGQAEAGDAAAGDGGADSADGGNRGDGGDGGNGGLVESDLEAPRPVAPLSTASATTTRPTFRWALPRGIAGAQIELCRDRAMAHGCMTIDAPVASEVRPASGLSFGMWFWRVRGRAASEIGRRPSVTWQVLIPRHDGPTDTSVGAILDVDGDGYADLAVGAPGSMTHPGRVFVYAGSATGIRTAPSVTLRGLDVVEDTFGIAVAAAGDVNGDGFGDIVVGASGPYGQPGHVHLFFGSAAGVNASAGQSAAGPDGANAGFGNMVRAAGDLNGDGFADVVVGAAGAAGNLGRLHVFLGGPGGLGTSPSASLTGNDTTAAGLGASCGSLGDVNGDGFSDILVGEPLVNSFAGRVSVITGTATGLSLAASSSLAGPLGANAIFGDRIAHACDVDGDGRVEVVVGASRANRVLLVRPRAMMIELAATLTASPPAGGRFGIPVVCGDINGDGYDDVLAGAIDTPSLDGSVAVAFGRATFASGATDATLRSLDGAGSAFGSGLAVGDVNGDGVLDIAVGAPAGTGPRPRVHVFNGPFSTSTTISTVDLDDPETGSDTEFGLALAM